MTGFIATPVIETNIAAVIATLAVQTTSDLYDRIVKK